ncbi:MAG TPA: thiamine phosphate synthase, partial [Dehalococcoidia bacterium]|nr:thiamine phosphate synthase [Dehalococcoidia bacterium]
DKIHDKGAMLTLSRALRDLCAAAGVVFIVNDHADVAVAADAGGVHVGQQDLPVGVARDLVPIDRIVGCSTNNPEEAAAAVAAGADYVGVGAMFASGSKLNTRPAGPGRIPLVRAAVPGVPIVAIGGIVAANVAEVVRAGADAVAVISAIGAAPDPEAAARELTALIQAARPAPQADDIPPP